MTNSNTEQPSDRQCKTHLVAQHAARGTPDRPTKPSAAAVECCMRRVLHAAECCIRPNAACRQVLHAAASRTRQLPGRVDSESEHHCNARVQFSGIMSEINECLALLAFFMIACICRLFQANLRSRSRQASGLIGSSLAGRQTANRATIRDTSLTTH